MFQKAVKITITLEQGGKPQELTVLIPCNPSTPDTELIRRAGNIFREAANQAKYSVVK
jgi:hypothetical protein